MLQPWSSRPLRFVALALVLLCSATTSATDRPAASPAAAAAPAITWTYLKANPGDREHLAGFLEANWLAMDAQAVEAGLFRGYRMLVNEQADGEWDVVVEVTYNDACGYACVADAFEAIRARHVEQRVDGRDLRELGRVLRTETVRARG
jgi:hypothetical protein